MSATIIRLTPRSKIPSANGSPNTVEQAPAADPSDAFLEGTRVRLLLKGLRAQQETLLSVIEGLRVPKLQAHSNLGRSATDLEVTSTKVLVEVGLLIQHGTAVLRRLEKASS